LSWSWVLPYCTETFAFRHMGRLQQRSDCQLNRGRGWSLSGQPIGGTEAHVWVGCSVRHPDTFVQHTLVSSN